MKSNHFIVDPPDIGIHILGKVYYIINAIDRWSIDFHWTKLSVWWTINWSIYVSADTVSSLLVVLKPCDGTLVCLLPDFFWIWCKLALLWLLLLQMVYQQLTVCVMYYHLVLFVLKLVFCMLHWVSISSSKGSAVGGLGTGFVSLKSLIHI